jgi:hypothetical protein
LDPKFSKVFSVNYFFEEVQKVKFAVYDLDNSTPTLSDDDFLGYLETTLGEVLNDDDDDDGSGGGGMVMMMMMMMMIDD